MTRNVMTESSVERCSVSDFHDQFVLTQDPDEVPWDWPRRSCSGWVLAAHPSLPVADLCSDDGRSVGWLLGYAVGPDAKLAAQEICLRTAIGGSDWHASFEDELYEYGGRFTCVLIAAKSARVYLDPFGSLATVFGLKSRIVAATTTLVQVHQGGSPPEGRLKSDQAYPAGLTGDPQIGRLLPNHYLDLVRWRSVRHWPSAQIEPVSRDQTEEMFDVIAAVIRRSLRAVTASSEAYLTLTAGRDSRMLLACVTPDMAERITCVTFDYQNGKTGDAIDASKAKQLAHRCGLEHLLLPVEAVAEPVRQAYLKRIGFAGSGGKARDFDQACRRHLDLRRGLVTSFGGEVTTCPFLRRRLDPADPPTPQNYLARLKFGDTPRFREAMQQWIDDLPEMDVHRRNDLLWLENALACLSTPHLYGAAPFGLNLIPFCHRQLVEASYRLPVTDRLRKPVADALVRRAEWDIGSIRFGWGRFP